VKNPSAAYRTVLLLLIALCAPPAVLAQAHDTQSKSQPSAAEIIKGLQSTNLADREKAAKAAAAIKPLPQAVVPSLLNSLRGLESKPSNDTVSDAIREQWRYSGDLVTALGNAGAPAIPDLSRALDDSDEAVRRGAVDALIVIARVSPQAWPVLIGALGNTHDDVPDRIEETIEANGNQAFAVKIVPLLQRSLADPNPKVRGASAVTLSTILAANGSSYCNSYVDDLAKMRPPWTDWKGPPPGDLILDIAKVFNSVDRDKIPQILSSLCGLGPPAKVAIPYLLPLLRDRDGPIRFGVLFDLSAMGPAACVAIPDAMRSLKDPDKGVRLRAMAVLGVCGRAAKEAVPELAIALKSTDQETAQQAALALANIDPSHDGLLPVLTQMLDPSYYDPGPRQNAVHAFDEMGSYARPAFPVLIHLIATDTDTDDSDDKASERAAQVVALAHIDGTDAIPELVHVTSTDKDDEVRIAAVTALGGFGSKDPRAISALVDALNNDSDAVRDAASEALSKLGTVAVPALITALKSTYLYQRAWAIQALGGIKPMPNDAKHALKLALNDKSEIVRAEAESALKDDTVKAHEAIRQQQIQEDFDRDNGPAQGLDSFIAGKPTPDNRSYSKAGIVASIPPDENHESPYELKYFLPITPLRSHTGAAEFIVTIHSSKDATDQLALWKKTGDDRYERLFVQQAESDASFLDPALFSSRVLVTNQGKEHYETDLFVDLPMERTWGDGAGVDDSVFVLDRDQLRPVTIADAEEDSKKIHRDETVWNGSLGNEFSDNRLKFGFTIWKNHDGHCCPTAGEVTGSYKVVKEMHYDAQKKDWVANWKMVVDTAKRVPIPKD
jgi:HEAT repeat protein